MLRIICGHNAFQPLRNITVSMRAAFCLSFCVCERERFMAVQVYNSSLQPKSDSTLNLINPALSCMSPRKKFHGKSLPCSELLR